MPELPEVETIRKGLQARVVGKTIRVAEGEGGRLTRNNPGGAEQVRSALAGSKIISVERRGKFMWWVLDGPEDSLVVHLGMSGQVRTSSADPELTNEESFQKGPELGRHEHLRLTLDDGSQVHFIDPRMFGQLTLSTLVKDAMGRLIPSSAAHIAPDVLELETDHAVDQLVKQFKSRNRFVKTMLLDQQIVSGIGNIYADEALFASGIQGARQAAKLPLPKLRTLIQECRSVTRRAVKVGGTSFDDLYVDVDGNPGYFERELFVYGREDHPCRRCGTTVKRITLQGRSHFFCPRCQPKPRATKTPQ